MEKNKVIQVKSITKLKNICFEVNFSIFASKLKNRRLSELEISSLRAFEGRLRQRLFQCCELEVSVGGKLPFDKRAICGKKRSFVNASTASRRYCVNFVELEFIPFLESERDYLWITQTTGIRTFLFVRTCFYHRLGVSRA